jgi:hypothetical protein
MEQAVCLRRKLHSCEERLIVTGPRLPGSLAWPQHPNTTQPTNNMAESPELLAGYSALWDLFSKSTLVPHEQQVV